MPPPALSNPSPAPPSLGLAGAAMLTAVAGLLIIAIAGDAVRANVTDPELHRFASGSLYLTIAAAAVTVWIGAKSLSLALRSRKETVRRDILPARASAARSRDLGLIVFGSTLAVTICFFLAQMILFNDGKIQKTFLRWDLMTAPAADVAWAFLVNIRLGPDRPGFGDDRGPVPCRGTADAR